MVTRHLHVIPVDAIHTADEAWQEVCIFGRRLTYSGLGEYWAVIRCDGEECSGIEDGRTEVEVIEAEIRKVER